MASLPPPPLLPAVIRVMVPPAPIDAPGFVLTPDRQTLILFLRAGRQRADLVSLSPALRKLDFEVESAEGILR
jgi:hypothetical protein